MFLSPGRADSIHNLISSHATDLHLETRKTLVVDLFVLDNSKAVLPAFPTLVHVAVEVLELDPTLRQSAQG